MHRSYEPKLTLDFFTFSAVAVATVAAPRRDAYHSTGNLAGYRMIYDTCGASRGGQVFPVGEQKRGAERVTLSFEGVTLDFSTKSTTAPATVVATRRDIYRSIENFKGFRMVYVAPGASRVGRRYP